MPVYDYECPNCGRPKEILVKNKEEEKKLAWCYVCDLPMLRMVSIPAKTTVGKYGKGGGL